jgi:hypothetical protein
LDKKGNPIYLRLPLKLEALIEEQAKKEGRSKNEMVIHLVARGLHQSNFLIDHYCNSFDDIQANNR